MASICKALRSTSSTEPNNRLVMSLSPIFPAQQTRHAMHTRVTKLEDKLQTAQNYEKLKYWMKIISAPFSKTQQCLVIDWKHNKNAEQKVVRKGS